MGLLAFVSDVTQNPTVQRTLWEWLLMVAGGITVMAGASVIVWKVAVKPHVEKFIAQAAEVHKSVTVNGGRNSPPTLRDEVNQVGKKLDTLAHIAGKAAQRAEDLGDKVDLLTDLTKDTRDDLHDHIQSGEQYLGQVRVVLSEKGIEIPRPIGRGEDQD